MFYSFELQFYNVIIFKRYHWKSTPGSFAWASYHRWSEDQIITEELERKMGNVAQGPLYSWLAVLLISSLKGFS